MPFCNSGVPVSAAPESIDLSLVEAPPPPGNRPTMSKNWVIPFLMILTLAVTFHPQLWGLLHLPTAPLPLRGPCHVKFKDHQS